MSRIGRALIPVPAAVEVKLENGVLTVKGPKGTLTQKVHPKMELDITANQITVKRSSEEKFDKSLHGLTRSLVNNMVVGVTEGFKKELDINGVGYKAVKEGKKLVMNLGYSHQVILDEVDGILVEVPAPTKIIVSGIDKQLVGQFAADVRKQRPPEPYKGKGIKYSTERIRRKEGKTGSKKK